GLRDVDELLVDDEHIVSAASRDDRRSKRAEMAKGPIAGEPQGFDIGAVEGIEQGKAAAAGDGSPGAATSAAATARDWRAGTTGLDTSATTARASGRTRSAWASFGPTTTDKARG